MYYLSFHGSEIQAWLGWILLLGSQKAEMELLADLHSLLEVWWGKESFWAPSDLAEFLFLLLCLCFSLLLPTPILRILVIILCPPRKSRIISLLKISLFSNFHSNCKSHHPLPYNLKYSQLPRIKTWTSLGAVILSTIVASDISNA